MYVHNLTFEVSVKQYVIATGITHKDIGVTIYKPY